MSSVSNIVVLDLLGIFVFAISGSLVAVRKELDLFGVLVLAGAVAAAVLHELGLSFWLIALVGGSLCLLWRLLAIRRDWRAPMPTGPSSV